MSKELNRYRVLRYKNHPSYKGCDAYYEVEVVLVRRVRVTP